MKDDDDDPMAKDEGHRYEAPEPKEETRSKGVDYLILGILVIVLMVLIATGVVPIFGY